MAYRKLTLDYELHKKLVGVNSPITQKEWICFLAWLPLLEAARGLTGVVLAYIMAAGHRGIRLVTIAKVLDLNKDSILMRLHILLDVGLVVREHCGNGREHKYTQRLIDAPLPEPGNTGTAGMWMEVDGKILAAANKVTTFTNTMIKRKQREEDKKVKKQKKSKKSGLRKISASKEKRNSSGTAGVSSKNNPEGITTQLKSYRLRKFINILEGEIIEEIGQKNDTVFTIKPNDSGQNVQKKGIPDGLGHKYAERLISPRNHTPKTIYLSGRESIGHKEVSHEKHPKKKEAVSVSFNIFKSIKNKKSLGESEGGGIPELRNGDTTEPISPAAKFSREVLTRPKPEIDLRERQRYIKNNPSERPKLRGWQGSGEAHWCALDVMGYWLSKWRKFYEQEDPSFAGAWFHQTNQRSPYPEALGQIRRFKRKNFKYFEEIKDYLDFIFDCVLPQASWMTSALGLYQALAAKNSNYFWKEYKAKEIATGSKHGNGRKKKKELKEVWHPWGIEYVEVEED